LFFNHIEVEKTPTHRRNGNILWIFHEFFSEFRRQPASPDQTRASGWVAGQGFADEAKNRNGPSSTVNHAAGNRQTSKDDGCRADFSAAHKSAPSPPPLSALFYLKKNKALSLITLSRKKVINLVEI
jgi:hypothetical protein